MLQQLSVLELRQVGAARVAALLRVAPALVHLDPVRVDESALDGTTLAELRRILGRRVVFE